MTESSKNVDQRIVFFNRFYYPDISATSQLLTDLSLYLVSEGYSVTVITSRQTYDNSKATLKPRDTYGGVDVIRIPTFQFGRRTLLGRFFDYVSFYLSALVEGFRTVERGDICVAKTDPPLLSVIVAFVALFRGAHLVNWLQDIFPEIAVRLGMGGVNKVTGSLLSKTRDWTLRRARVSVVLGNRMRDYVVSRVGDCSKVVVIPNWTNESEVVPIAHEYNPMRRSAENNLVVGYSGNLGRAHEIDTLLAGAGELSASSIRFEITGGGALFTILKAECAARGFGHFSFRSYEPRERLAQSLCAADVHLVILRPELEGLIVPSKVYGILAAGRPIIFVGDQAGEVAEILSRYQCGIQVDVGDGIGLANSIRALASSPSMRAQMGANARAAACGTFAHGNSLLAWANALKSMR